MWFNYYANDCEFTKVSQKKWRKSHRQMQKKVHHSWVNVCGKMTSNSGFSRFQVICVLITVAVQHCQCQIIQRCPDYQVHFEKIIGFRPPLPPYGIPPKLLFKSFSQIPSVINLQCMERCRNDHNCESYMLNFNQSECYGFTSNERRLNSFNLRRLDDHELAEDIGVVYFVKTCLNSEYIGRLIACHSNCEYHHDISLFPLILMA